MLVRAGLEELDARLAPRWNVVSIFADHEGSRGWRGDLEAAGLEYVRTCSSAVPHATERLRPGVVARF